jgi:regulator of sirC expression with transglutaminase-like and TPR domain
MASTGFSNSITDLSDSQRAALVTLLADDDPGVYQSIRTKIVACGPPVAEWLRPYTRSEDPALRRRAREIVTLFDRQAADTQFLAFCLRQGEDLDLEEGAWLLALTRYPDINVEAYRALLDGYASEIRQRLLPDRATNEILKAVNDYLFELQGFAGNEQNYYESDNTYLNRVIDRKTGNPISLSLLYMLLTRRLSLPVAGIGLPGHFVCRYQSSMGEVYIDPFNGGRLLSKLDCVNYLSRRNYPIKDEYLAPVSARKILLRMCSNLHRIYTQLEYADETVRMHRYIVALSR